MVSLRVGPSPLGETQVVTLDYASFRDVGARRRLPGGEQRMAEREGWWGGEREERRRV